MSAPNLEPWVVSSAEDDHAKTGFNHRHVAASEHIRAIAGAFLEAGYFLEMITCEDRREELSKLRLVYTFNQFGECDRHYLTIDVDPADEGMSLASIYAGADWFEREVYDMYGVRFANHPNLKRLLLPDDADFHALLKDFGRIEDAPADEPAEAAEESS